MGAATSRPGVPEQGLLEAARGGGEDAFGRLVEPYRSGLHAHCYRMLASVHDAEDALQDTLLRAWRGLHGFDDRSAFRPWLYKIATNVCLDAIALAFIAALQHLPGRQRAVLLLREVLGFSAKEVAGALDSTTASVNSALQRARSTIDARLPQESQQATMRSLGDERLREIVQRFVDAFESGEVEAILEVLAEDATFSMPPYATWYRGRDAIADSWLMPGGPPPRLRYVPTRANGQPALGTYQLVSEEGRYAAIALDVLTLRGTEISDITVFRTPEVFALFGLPDELPA